jgi:VWFA-related protein
VIAGKEPAAIAERYTMFLFDDMNLLTGDLMYVRAAAEKHLGTELLPTERIGVYMTSGRITLGPTTDREAIISTMRKIQPVGRAAAKKKECPPMTSYQAYAIDRCGEGSCPPLQIAVEDAYGCAGLDRSAGQAAAFGLAQGAAHDTLALAEVEARETLINVRNIIRGLAVMPGERNLILISPGFYNPSFRAELGELIDLAIRGRVTLNALDARGLHTLGTVPDSSQRITNPAMIPVKMQYERWDAEAGSMLLEELAEGTGGIVFESSNDLVGGFKKLTVTPEYTYILGFSPQNIKLDGSLHTLKVKIRNGGHIRCRRDTDILRPSISKIPSKKRVAKSRRRCSRAR